MFVLFTRLFFSIYRKDNYIEYPTQTLINKELCHESNIKIYLTLKEPKKENLTEKNKNAYQKNYVPEMLKVQNLAQSK